jgi:hypothetical protein
MTVSVTPFCEQADVLAPIEHALARNVITWLERAGIG